MYSESWNLKCIKSFSMSFWTFKEGCEYRVKDKFPDDTGDVEKGVWEVCNSGSLFNIDYTVRKKYFIPV